MLGCGGDGLVLGGELGDRAPLFLFGSDGLVRGEFRADVLQNAVEHGLCVRVRVVAGMRGRVSVIGMVCGDVGVVAVPATGHCDVEVLPRRLRGDDDVRGVGGDSLGAVRGDGVAEVP